MVIRQRIAQPGEQVEIAVGVDEIGLELLGQTHADGSRACP
jgi:hypothetical protein